MRPLIEAGYIYFAMPPLYKITINKKDFYAYDEVDKKKILLKDPIKTVGDYAVEVRLMEGVTAKIFVSVVPAE